MSVNQELYTFKRVSREQLGALNEIAQDAFGHTSDLKELEQKFETKEFGAEYIGYIAYDQQDMPAAYYGVFPLQVQIDGFAYLAAQSGNTMTHRNHQGNGLFTRLALESYQLARDEKIQLIFGFPNSNSYPGFVKKLNWEHPEDLQKYSIKVATFPVAALAYKSTLINKIYRFLMRKNFRKRTFFESSVLASGQNGVLRDEKFWNYKSSSGNFTFEAAGGKVWAKINGAFYIGDIEYNPAADYNLVFKKIEKQAFKWGCHKVVLQCSDNTWLSSVIPSRYKSSNGLPFGYLRMNQELPVGSLRFTMADFDTF